MKLITREQLAETAAARWAHQYHPQSAYFSPARQAIGAALAALPSPVDADIVDRIVGNQTWTRYACDNSACASLDAAGVAAYQDGPWVEIDVTGGEYTTHLCLDCIGRIAALDPSSEDEA